LLLEARADGAAGPGGHRGQRKILFHLLLLVVSIILNMAIALFILQNR
jgi:hypothetical protein